MKVGRGRYPPGGCQVTIGLPLAVRMPSLSQVRPHMPPITSAGSIASDGNDVSNSAQASGAYSITRSVADTSKVNGLGGRLDLLG